MKPEMYGLVNELMEALNDYTIAKIREYHSRDVEESITARELEAILMGKVLKVLGVNLP